MKKKQQVRAAFKTELVTLPLASLLPTKEVTDPIRQSPKYLCIASTLAEVGLVEPLVVYEKPDNQGRRLLLDGHLRQTILMERGVTEVECILAEDDEAFTYNKRINRLAVVQEHFMIVRAIDRGISQERLARALNVEVDYIKRRQILLKRICPEAISLLSDKPVNPVVFDELRKMKPARQIEASKLMAAATNYSSAYAKALLRASKDSDLMRPRRPPLPPIVTTADLALMERELKTAQQDFKTTESSYGEDMLHLVIATGYVAKLIENQKIARYLDENHPEILKGFRELVSATSLDPLTPPDGPRGRRNWSKSTNSSIAMPVPASTKARATSGH